MNERLKKLIGLLNTPMNQGGGLLGNIPQGAVLGASLYGQGIQGKDPFAGAFPALMQTAQLQKLMTPKKGPKKRAYDPKTKTVVFADDITIEKEGYVPEPKDPIITKFNTLTGTYQTGPKSSFPGMEEKGAKITDAKTQYDILVNLTDDMKSRLPNTPTKAVGLGFGITESLSDQFSQIGESLGIKETLEIKNPETIDQYLESKGFTQKAANYATMKGSVINLGYILAKIKEPNNPRLSEGDIIRQLNRINFGGSREVFAQSLNQILKESRIEAEGLIKGLGGDPEKVLNINKKKKINENPENPLDLDFN